MCNVLVAHTIIEILDEKVQNGDVFTAFDVTSTVRKRTDDDVIHNDVRNIVNNEFITQQMIGYDRELCTLNLSGNPQALVYFPNGKQATNHPLVDSSTVTVTDSDSDTDTDVEDDEYKLTAKGRLNIPRELLAKISSVAGTYDCLVNGSLKCVSPNKDGRVRLSLKRLGIFNGKIKLTVDTLSNTINIDTV